MTQIDEQSYNEEAHDDKLTAKPLAFYNSEYKRGEVKRGSDCTRQVTEANTVGCSDRTEVAFSITGMKLDRRSMLYQ